MTKVLNGNLKGQDVKVGIVVGEFNSFITKSLLDGALASLKGHGVVEENITVVWVPGAFEIPLIAKKMAQQAYDVIITLGLVIRGDTPHFDYVCNEAASGISEVSLQTGKPIIFGILTTDSIEQAIARAGTTCGNKGSDAATAAIEMVNLVKQIGGK